MDVHGLDLVAEGDSHQARFDLSPDARSFRRLSRRGSRSRIGIGAAACQAPPQQQGRQQKRRQAQNPHTHIFHPPSSGSFLFSSLDQFGIILSDIRRKSKRQTGPQQGFSVDRSASGIHKSSCVPSITCQFSARSQGLEAKALRNMPRSALLRTASDYDVPVRLFQSLPLHEDVTASFRLRRADEREASPNPAALRDHCSRPQSRGLFSRMRPSR